jgi:signal transduction histidine kinase
MERIDRRTAMYWLALGVLAIICCVLAVLQYRWIGEISRAEQERLRSGLQTSLQRLSQNFNTEIEAACAALQPSNRQVEEQGREAAYAARYEVWRHTSRHADLFSAIGVAVPVQSDITLLQLNRDSGEFSSAPWPSNWTGMRQQLAVRLRGGGPPFAPDASNVIEVPRFAPPAGPGQPPRSGERRGEQDWLVVEINIAYVKSTLLPALLATHLGRAAASEYDVEVFARFNPSEVIYRSRPEARMVREKADASVSMFAIRHGEIARRSFRNGRIPASPGRGPAFGSMTPPEGGRWEMAVQSRAGSLGALVERTRWRNLILSGVILMLLMVTVGLVLQFSRKTHQLAELQMNFVAGVSHELRTPLTVIRTAAFNLRGRLSGNPAHVEKYGALIQDEAEKLTALVEQVLRFSSARAGHVITERNPVAVDDLIEQLLASRKSIIDAAGVTVEKRFDAELPVVLGDEVALRHAVQNLLDNAVKYGSEGSNWIGVSALRVDGDRSAAVEIRVADRGRGIPPDEQSRIFDPFFRGRRAIEDQIHGTGLGLNLVKKIAEAHGGSVRVQSDSLKGTEFILRLPAAPPELQNEFAPSFS